MDRLTRLYAVAEHLRARAPRLVTVTELAEEFGVSRRTVQRDLQALMASGLPVRWQDGRGGGWTVDPSMSLPPVNLTADEAIALLLAVTAARGTAPLGRAADSAWHKVAAVLDRSASSATARWTTQVAATQAAPATDQEVVRAAVESRRALRLTYTDRHGAASTRVVEPVGLLTGHGRWYLVAWCRTREAVRGFRLDRIGEAGLLDEVVPERDLASVLREDGASSRSAAGSHP